jgi:hypothetical protein
MATRCSSPPENVREHVGDRANSPLDRVGRDVRRAQRKRDVIVARHRRKQRNVLEQQADATPVRR